MWFSTHDDQAETPPEEIDLYAVLNLNRAASQAEINERYRALSLLFHPDKQQNPERKEVAEVEYLKVQKAYQVLSDPFLRQVYDVLGSRGLDIKWPEEFSSQAREKIEEGLRQLKENAYMERPLEPDARPNAVVTTMLDVSSLIKPVYFVPLHRKPPGTQATRQVDEFEDKDETEDALDDDSEEPLEDEPLEDVIQESVREALAKGLPKDTWARRWEGVIMPMHNIKYTASARLNSSTVLKADATAALSGHGNGYASYMGAVKHQFSPRFRGKAAVGLRYPHALVLGGSYRDDFNTAELSVSGAAIALRQTWGATLSVGRRLFEKSHQTAELSLHVGNTPNMSILYSSPASLSEEFIEGVRHGLPSRTGFRYYARDTKYGLTWARFVPKIFGEVGITFVELSTRVKARLELGILGSGLILGMGWVGERSQASFESSLSNQGVMIKFEVLAWKQQFTLPIVLSHDLDPTVALYSVVVPAVATALSYHFFLQPRRRSRRIEQIRAARRAIEEDSDARRKRNAVIDLLRDAANKYTSLETDKGGLIIQEAWYGVTDGRDGAEDLAVDVTIAVQALVRDSHLYIPGGSSKSHLQGFSDPAPYTPKSLRIRYVFRGRSHYAEIPEYLPVVLPLSEHSVEGC